MRKRRNILVLGVAACALLATSCGTEEPTPGPTPTPETYKLTVNKDSGVESVTITSGGTEVTDLTRIEEGTELTAVIDLKDDYEISAVTLNGDAVSATGGSYVFDMPSKDATLAVTTSVVAPEVSTITVTNDDTKGAYTLTKGDTAVTDGKVNVGDTVKLTVTPNTGYTVASVTLDGTALTLADGAYSFTASAATHAVAINYDEVAPEVSTITVTNDDTKGTYTLTKGDTAVTDGKVNVGDTVKLTVTPNTGYTVASVTLDGTALTLTDGAYSFTASAATHAVAINYDEVKVNVSLTVYDEPSYDFYEDAQLLSGDTDVTDGADVRVGSELKVVLTASGDRGTFEETEYIKILGKIYLHVGDVVYHGDDENAVVSEDFLTLTFTIKAPEKDADIVLSYNSYRATEDDETAVTVTMAENENLEFYGYSATDKYVNQRFQVGIKRKPGYVITKATLTYEDSTTEEVTNSYVLPQFTNDYAMWTYGAGALKGNVTISFEGEIKDVYAITYVNGASVTADVTFETSKIAGEMVRVNNIKSSDSAKSISEIKFTGVDCTASYSPYSDSWSYNFTMPANEVTIEFVFVDLVELTYAPNENLDSVVFSSNSFYNDSYVIQYAKPGSTVYAFAAPKDGYLLGDAVSNDGTSYQAQRGYGSTVYSYYYAVTVPEDGLTLTISADVAYDVTADPETTGKVSTSISNEQAIEGATVNFTYRPTSSLYVVNDVYLENSDGEKLDITITQTPGSYSTSCSFIMPAEDVTICYDVLEAKKYTAAVNVIVPDGEELTSVMTRFSLTNRDSGVNASTYTEGMTADLVENTETNIQLNLASGYEATATYTYTVDGADKTVEIGVANMSSGSVYFNSFRAPANIKSIDITITKATPVKATLTHDDTMTDDEFARLEFAYRVNGQSVTDLSKVYKGDNLMVEITSEAESGYVYQFEITDSEGNPINGSGSYQITGDFTITVSKVQAYSYEFVFDGVNQGMTFLNLILSDDTYLYSDRGGSGLIYGSGLQGRLTPTYVGSSIDYVVTVGGTEAVSGTFEANSYEVYSEWFDITGNVVITLTPHAE